MELILLGSRNFPTGFSTIYSGGKIGAAGLKLSKKFQHHSEMINYLDDVTLFGSESGDILGRKILVILKRERREWKFTLYDVVNIPRGFQFYSNFTLVFLLDFLPISFFLFFLLFFVEPMIHENRKTSSFLVNNCEIVLVILKLFSLFFDFSFSFFRQVLSLV